MPLILAARSLPLVNSTNKDPSIMGVSQVREGCNERLMLCCRLLDVLVSFHELQNVTYTR